MKAKIFSGDSPEGIEDDLNVWLKKSDKGEITIMNMLQSSHTKAGYNDSIIITILYRVNSMG